MSMMISQLLQIQILRFNIRKLLYKITDFLLIINMFKNFKTFKMPFREVVRDEEGNVKYDKNGSPIYTKVNLVIRYNPYYIVK